MLDFPYYILHASGSAVGWGPLLTLHGGDTLPVGLNSPPRSYLKVCVLFPGGGGMVEGGGGAVGLGPRSVFSKGFIFKPAWLKTVVLGSAWGFREK